MDYYRSGAALDQYLADQLILPLALAEEVSSFTTSCITPHLLTNIWLVEQFLDRTIVVEGKEGDGGKVVIEAREDV